MTSRDLSFSRGNLLIGASLGAITLGLTNFNTKATSLAPTDTVDERPTLVIDLESTPAQLAQIVRDLAKTDSHVSSAEVAQRLVKLSHDFPEALPLERAAKLLSEWGQSTHDLGCAREIAEEWASLFPEIQIPTPEWVTQIKESHAAGWYVVKPDPKDGSIAVRYWLKPHEAREAQCDWIEGKTSIRVEREGALVHEGWINVLMPPSERILFSAVNGTNFTEQDVLKLDTQLLVYNDSYEVIARFSRGVQYGFRLGADGKTLEPFAQLPGGGELSAEATAVASAFDGIKSAEYRLRRAQEEQERATSEKTEEAAVPSPQNEPDPTPSSSSTALNYGSMVGHAAPPLTLVQWEKSVPRNALPDAGELNLKGSVTLIDFWAMWCGPCQIAMPRLGELHAAHQEKGFRVISVCSTRQPRDFANIAEYTTQHIGHLVALGTPESFENYKVTGIPRLVLIDREGIVRWEGVGAGSEPPAELLNKLLDTTP